MKALCSSEGFLFATMDLQKGEKIYFVSDTHLGAPNRESSFKREQILVKWLDEIQHDAKEIYIVGDLFDFWFEYKTVVPKGYVRLFGKLAELTDKGIAVYFFTGNHDMWSFGYFTEELGIPIYRKPVVREFNGKKFFIGHGDGLGPGDHGYKFLKKVFANPLCQWLFKWLHPDIGVSIANYWSRRSRLHTQQVGDEGAFQGESREWLVAYCRKKLETEQFNYFVFGHRHLAIDYGLTDTSRYINLGDWLTFYTYAVFDGENMELKYYRRP